MNIRISVVITFLLSCIMSIAHAQPSKTENARFDVYKGNFVEKLWKINPSWASSVGYHKYDDVLIVPDAASRATELSFCKKELDTLKTFNVNNLTDANRTDYLMIQSYLKNTEWSIAQLKGYEWDPSVYNVSGLFADILGNEYDLLDNRLRSFYRKLIFVPAYYEAAKNNIKNPTLEHTALAIEQNMGGIPVFETDLKEALAKSSLSEGEKTQYAAAAALAVTAIKDYAEWLGKLDNKTPRSFRLGKKLYEEKFGHELQSGFTAEEIYKQAIAHKKELHTKMYATTQRLWTKYYKTAMPADTLTAIRQMIDRLSDDHVTAVGFQTAIEEQLPELAAFIKRKDLLFIDPTKPLVVRKEPAYMAGVAGASINSPGPYDKNGNTYYNVGSLEGWDKDKAESYLREYNKYILQILNIHEAIPGHYTQLVYANQSPSIIKSILGNNAMIEGWAVYAELMMLENGYGAIPLSPTDEAPPEMWLMYYKWNMRSTCNTILDYSVHTANMSKDAAMKLLVNEAFQQQAEAEGKWKRVTVSQVQLCCYFTGFTEICNLRDAMKKKSGKNFSLKQFHEQFLSYGSAPVKHIRALMLK
ncbi:MAG: DUF885 domain-containing protein [Taibaiella sp.]|nr:DUF885 domain-containing protein [Taibaiella sp.]